MKMLESYERDGTLVMKPRMARLDARAAPAFRAEALSALAGHRSVLFLMDDVEAIDSTGLGCLVAVLKAVPPGGQLRLVGLRPSVRTLLKLTRLDRVFTQFDSVEAALAA